MKFALSALTALLSTGTALAADAPAPAAGAQQGNAFSAFLPLIIFIAIFYFFILRPQKKRQKTHDNMVSSLQRGDKVITAGGFFGIVRDVKEDSVIIELAEGLVARILKSSISTKINPEAPKPAAKSGKTEAPKTEAPKAEAPKTEAPQAEAPKAEAPKAEEASQTAPADGEQKQ